MTANFAKIAATALVPFLLFNPLAAYKMRSAQNARIEESAPKHELKFDLIDYDEPMEVHKKAQKNFVAISTSVGKPKYQGKSELSRPSPAVLAWNIETEENLAFEKYTVYFGMKSDLSDAKKYICDDNEISIYNVLLGAKYYWRVSVEIDGKEYKSQISSFETEDGAPRNLYVDGVTNVRDMGGWKTEDGRVTKQGMVYRTGKLHSDDERNISDKGIKTMLEEMGVKTEIDLRNEITPTEYGVLGESVKYVVIPMAFRDDSMFEESEQIRDFFKVLGDKNNYPVFFHCAIGTDRTGVCAFLLNALLGVSQEDLFRDYLFSNMGYIGGERDGHNIAHDLELLDRFDGDTIAERTHNYLLSIGVTEGEIKTIISVMK